MMTCSVEERMHTIHPLLLGKRLLITDDNERMLTDAVHILTAVGMIVEVCTNFVCLEQTLAQRAHEFAAAIVDLHGIGTSFVAERDLPRLVHTFPALPLIIFTDYADQARRLREEDDVRGYVHKKDYIQGLLNALKDVLINGTMHYSQTMREDVWHIVSRREREVLALAAHGQKTLAIALQLNLSPNTINEYKERVRAKFGADNFTHAVYLATKEGLI